jgi:hypothetical protein
VEFLGLLQELGVKQIARSVPALTTSVHHTWLQVQGILIDKAQKASVEAERRARAEAAWMQLQVGVWVNAC